MRADGPALVLVAGERPTSSLGIRRGLCFPKEAQKGPRPGNRAPPIANSSRLRRSVRRSTRRPDPRARSGVLGSSRGECAKANFASVFLLMGLGRAKSRSWRTARGRATNFPNKRRCSGSLARKKTGAGRGRASANATSKRPPKTRPTMSQKPIGRGAHFSQSRVASAGHQSPSTAPTSIAENAGGSWATRRISRRWPLLAVPKGVRPPRALRRRCAPMLDESGRRGNIDVAAEVPEAMSSK
mmetsp:Transcript_80467/g.232498  ORF Transcript_80467/g.232498 Transcript_80467/m.232498 type:complete len:242 (-) Transcript_80467:277-1002(-)